MIKSSDPHKFLREAIASQLKKTILRWERKGCGSNNREKCAKYQRDTKIKLITNQFLVVS